MNRFDKAVLERFSEISENMGESFFKRALLRKHAADALEAVKYLDENGVFDTSGKTEN